VPLLPSPRLTMCEWKGEACYIDLDVPGAGLLRSAGWWYPQPDLRYPQLTDRVAVYAGPFDEVTLDGEAVRRSRASSTAAGSPLTSWARSKANPAAGTGCAPVSTNAGRHQADPRAGP
jgi:Domain of unknown function (DUF427)